MKTDKNGGNETNGAAATENADDAGGEDGNEDGADSLSTEKAPMAVKAKPKVVSEPTESGDDNDDVEMDADEEEALLAQVEEQMDEEDEAAVEEDDEDVDIGGSDGLSDPELDEEIEELSKQRRFPKGPYIKLSCVHCRISCQTFKVRDWSTQKPGLPMAYDFLHTYRLTLIICTIARTKRLCDALLCARRHSLLVCG